MGVTLIIPSVFGTRITNLHCDHTPTNLALLSIADLAVHTSYHHLHVVPSPTVILYVLLYVPSYCNSLTYEVIISCCQIPPRCRDGRT